MDTRPAEFWAVADLVRGDAGVRMLSATGHTCTVILTQRPEPRTTSTEDSEEDEEGEETVFQMIDEGIVEWVRKHKSAFGLAVAEAGGAGESVSAEGEVVGKGGDSDSDSNFEEESGESDGGSLSSSGSSSDPGEHEGGEDSDNEGGADESTGGSAEPEGDDADEDIVELDPKSHPLLRAAAAGAIPKMSRTAIDAAVGLVVEDLVGPSASPPIHDERHNDEGESEEDELED